MNRTTPYEIGEFEVRRQSANSGEFTYVIRVVKSNRYIRLNQFYHSIIERLVDGETIERVRADLIAGNLTFNVEEYAQFIQWLSDIGLLRPPGHTDDHNSGLPEMKGSIVNRIIRIVLHSSLSIKNPDRFVERAYNAGGHILFAPVGLFILGAILMIGLAALINDLLEPAGSSVNLPPAYVIGLSLWGGMLFSVLLHELGHALTCKHFGRRISGFGLLLYLGIPGAFVDTSDAYFLPKWPRVAIDLAGIAANLLLVSICGLGLFFHVSPFAGILRLLVFLNLFYVFWNLIPFVKYDGYFALVDVLDYPNLRKEALLFALNIYTWRHFGSIRRSQWVLLIFGVASVGFTSLLLLAVSFYVYSILHRIIPHPYNTVFPMVAAAVLYLKMLQYAIRKMRHDK